MMIFFLPATFCFAQFAGTDFKFKTFTTQNGLVHNYTIKSRMDSKGFLWIATQNGLSRFDGYQFVNFQHKLNDSTSLPFNELTDIAIDRQDRIWLAYEKGLCYYDQVKHIFTKFSKPAVSICFDSINNKIWANNSTGLFAINSSTLVIEPAALQVAYANRPSHINIDSKQHLWISIERKGYYIYDIKKSSWKYADYDYWPRNIYEDTEGKIWINTWENGFQQYDEKDGANLKLRYNLSLTDLIYQDATQSLPLTGSDIIWVATHTSGIALFSKKQSRFVQWFQYNPAAKSGIATDFNSSIYTDRNGIIWICTWKGLTKINRQEQQFQSAELDFLSSQDYNLLSGIFDDPYNENLAWIGVNGLGLCYYDKINKRPLQWYFRNTPSNDHEYNYNWRWITNGIQDNNKALWFTSFGGLLKVEKNQVEKVPINYDDHIAITRNASVFADGYIWVSTDFGLARFNRSNNNYKIYRSVSSKKNGNSFSDVIELNENELLCATNKGLFSFDKKQERFKQVIISQADTVKKEWTGFTCLKKIGNKVFAASSSGLLEYDLVSGGTKILGREQEIFKLTTFSLFKDEMENLWIYTLHGVFRYSPARYEFRKFTTADGIYDNSSDPVQIFTYNKDIYIGYRMAYTKFDPAKADINNNLATPYITGISINNQKLKIATDSFTNKSLQLNYHENNIEFEYTAIDYTNSEKISFAYMLEGFDKDWIMGGADRKIVYQNLRGGSYTFKLKACNSSGLWNERYSSLKFYITPPLWQRWWFWPAIAVLFILLVLLLALKRIQIIRKKEVQKTAVNKMMAELETKLLRSQMNPHFIFNSLNSIQKYIWENKEEDAAEYLAKFAKLIRAILENSRKETISLKEEMDAMKLYIELEHRRSNGQFDYSIKTDERLDQENTLVPPMLMQPFIENAIWHGLNKKQAKGNLLVTVEKLNDKLICIIDDDGIGRQPKILDTGIEKKSLGIEITQQRIDRLVETTKQEASISIYDKKELGLQTGTTVTLTLPLQIK